MSVTIIKGLTIKNGEVWTRSSCNNVRPKDYTPRKQEYYTKAIQEGRMTFEDIERELIWSDITQYGVRLEIPKYREAIARTFYITHPQSLTGFDYHDKDQKKEVTTAILNNVGVKTKGNFVIELEEGTYLNKRTKTKIYIAHNEDQAKTYDNKEAALAEIRDNIKDFYRSNPKVKELLTQNPKPNDDDLFYES